MTNRVRRVAILVVLVGLLVGPADTWAISRSEVAPGAPAPPDGADPGIGPDALWPGPDGYGYSGSSCTYSWVDISSTGTEVLLGDDDSDGPFPIGFSFPFYDTAYTEFYTGSNGFISFGAGSTSLSDQCPLPNASTPDNLIALLWDDLDPGDTGDPVYYQSFAAGSCPWGSYAGACAVIEYLDFCHYPGGSGCSIAGTFEAILFDDGFVRIQYLDAGDEEGTNSTTGMEAADAASDWGLTYACNTAASLSDNLCIEMGQAPGINLDPDTIEGTGCPGDAITTTMGLFNNSGASATFALSYAISSANATIDGPASITVANLATGTFDVDVTPDAGLANCTPVTGTIDAVGGGYSDSSAIALTSTVIQDWIGLAATPTGTRYHAVAYHDGDIYQMGGETDWWTGTTAVHRYNIAANSWDTPAALPAAVYGAGAATVGDNVYVIGGSLCTEDPNDGCSAGSFSDAVYIFDTTAGTWSTDATDPLPSALAYGSVVTDGSLIYHIGGLDASGALAGTLYIYDPAGAAGSRWTTGNALTTARAYAASAFIDGAIYVAGGWLGGTSMTDTVEIYNVAGGTWSAGPAMPAAIAPLGGGELGVNLIAFAAQVSFSGSTTYTCSVTALGLNTSTGNWSVLADLPRCLYGTDGVSDGNNFFGISGRTNEGSWHMAVENQATVLCGPIPVGLMQFSIE